MKINKDKIIRQIPFYLSYLTLFIFLIVYIFLQNFEFLFYIGAILIFTIFIHILDNKYTFLPLGTYGYYLWLLMHMFGGSLRFNGKVLYNHMLIDLIGSPYNILKYDQFVHVYCYIVFTIMLYSILSKIIKKQDIVFFVILILVSSSIGAINEIIEFATVVLFPNTNVGGYTNTCLGLVCNFIGAFIASFFIMLKKKKK